MTDRIGDPQTVCPFVAFDDDRDHRGPGPDHRHRCFAETPAAPRALAHQAAYCLSAGFAGCPTFLDWARREAAPVRQESPVRSLRDAPAVRGGPAPGDPEPSAALAASAALGALGTSDTTAEPPPDDARWAAPPSWAADDAASRSEGFPADDGSPGPADASSQAVDGPPFLAGRSSRVPASPPVDDAAWAPPVGPTGGPIDDPYAPPDTRRDDRYGEVDDRPASPPVAEPRRSPVGYAPVAPSRTDQRPVAGAASRSGREHRDVSAPAWEEPRRHDSYPTLKARRGTAIPRPLAYALIVLVAGVALFMVPFLLNGLGGGDGDASPTPAASEPVEPTAEPTITPEPTPEEIVYVVKAGDTLSKIAAANGVTVDQILEANPGITNPNQIAVGDRIVIPQALPSEIVDDAITPEP